MSIDEASEYWIGECRSVSKSVRRSVIFEAHTKGGLTYRQISEALGDISRQRVMQIVREERSERRVRANVRANG